MKDSIVESVIKQFKERSEVGIEKYGVTLDRTDLSLIQWLQHAKEESMDLTLYLEKAIQELKTKLPDFPQTQNQPYNSLLGKHSQTY